MSATKIPSSNPFDDLDDEEDEEVSEITSTEGLATDHEPAQVTLLREHCLAIDEITQTKALNPFALEELRDNLVNIKNLLSKDIPESHGQVGACLKHLLSENVIENVYNFTTRQRDYAKEVRIFLLDFLTEVLARALQPLLIHQQILRPVNKLLRACEGTKDPQLTASLVSLLHQICILIQENQSLLDLFFIESNVNMQSRFLVLTSLIPHMHDMGDVGNRARDALLLCLSLADRLSGTNLRQFIATDCNFCQVLATGLSGLYSELPNSRAISLDDWQSPLQVIEEAVPELARFTQTLEFCNSVLQMAPKMVCDNVLSLVREGFLNQVMGAALLQPSEDAVLFAAGYLTVFLRHISDIALMREFLRFVMMSKHDGRPILTSLLQNISSSNHKLCSVTLELFHVLIDLNCEDVLLELVLKYLVPGHHVMPNQLAIVGSPDLYSQAARRFLQLIPMACINAERLFLESIQQSATSPSSTEDPLIFTSSPAKGLKQPTPTHTKGKPLNNTVGVASLNPFDTPPQHGTRSRSGSDASSGSLVSITSSSSAQQGSSGPTTAAGNPISPISVADEERKAIGVGKYTPKRINGPAFQFEYVSLEMAYSRNLMVARDAILRCANCCRCWSSPYDRCIVSKEALEDALKAEQPVKKSLEMEDVSVRVRVTDEGEEQEDNFNFRSRATTVSVQRSVRTNHLRARRDLTENDSIHRPTEEAEVRTGSVSPQGIRRTETGNVSPQNFTRRRATMRDRTSPRVGRKHVANSFEDKIGLFLKIVFEKLFDMLQFPPSLNILLTRLIIRLAQFPQPLLRSLLLNHQLVLRQGIPNLFYVLQTIKTTIDSYSRTQDGFEKRLGRARKTMIYRATVRNTQIEPSTAKQMITRLLRQGSRVDMGLEPPPTEGPSAASTGTPERTKSLSDDLQPVTRSRSRTEGASLKSSVRVRKKKVSTDSLFAIVIFDEFLRELAALSQEHSVLNPSSYLPKSMEE